MSERPEGPRVVETTTEARAGSKTLANRNVMIISILVVVVAFVAVYAYFA